MTQRTLMFLAIALGSMPSHAAPVEPAAVPIPVPEVESKDPLAPWNSMEVHGHWKTFLVQDQDAVIAAHSKQRIKAPGKATTKGSGKATTKGSGKPSQKGSTKRPERMLDGHKGTPRDSRSKASAIDSETSLVPQTKVRVYLPEGYDEERRMPLLIALAGWKHDSSQWEKESLLAQLADYYGFIAVCPSMGRSVFETSFYKKETREPWNARPGAEWIVKVLLPWAQTSFRVVTDRSGTAVLGYSTGGHGAMLICERWPVFGWCGGMSGTYDFASLPDRGGERRIHEAVYGKASRFPDRWKRDDVVPPEQVAALQGSRVFIAHGMKDRVVDYSQTNTLAEGLRKAGIPFTEVLDPEGGHDWKFWNRQLIRAMEDWASLLRGP